MFRTMRVPFFALTVLSGCLVFSGSAFAANNAESDEVSKILSSAKMQAYQLNEDGDALERYSRSKSSWESHADAINKIRDDVNRMGALLGELERNRNSAAAWQQVAIDRVVPVAKELAANTTAAIDHLDKFPKRLNSSDYQEYLEAIADSAANLSATITNFVEYGKTKQRLDRLSAKLELPAAR